MRILRKPHPLAMFNAWFLMVFLVLFPKGGVKFGNIPLTWGYAFLALTAPALLLTRLLAVPLRLPIRVLAAFTLLLPFQVLYLYAGYFYGIMETGYVVSTFGAFFVFPFLFLFVYPPFFPLIDGVRLARYFRRCIFFAAVWGIFLFIWHPITGHFVEIPFLTVNSGDVGELELTKHISRGFFLKLISTYNNGNLYGVCTLMLLPLYDFHEPRRWRRLLVRAALLLTLSRTVWAGLIIQELLSLSQVLLRQVKTFPRLYLAQARRRVLALAVTICLILASLVFNANTIAFLFDPRLGGRSTLLFSLFNTTFLPSHPLQGFREIAYASASIDFGFTGLAAFTLLMLSPVLLLFVDGSAMQSPVRRAALKGLVLYSFLAGVDSGLNFIPTMAFFWFVYMIYLHGWPPPHASTQTHRNLDQPVPQPA